MLSPDDLHVIVGHDRMDEEHERLGRLILVLQDAALSGKGREAIAGAASDLVEFTREHFRHEESLMEAAGYGGVREHREDHAVLLQRLTLQLVALTLRAQPPTENDMDFFRDWFAAHIERFDWPLAEFLRTVASEKRAATSAG
jgi:hemerythrin-like metal-binding protein